MARGWGVDEKGIDYPEKGYKYYLSMPVVEILSSPLFWQGNLKTLPPPSMGVEQLSTYLLGLLLSQQGGGGRKTLTCDVLERRCGQRISIAVKKSCDML